MDHKYNNEGYLLVRENHYCEHWEPDDGALVPMKECWCCKWARFSADSGNLHSESVGVCCYSGNKEDFTDKEISCNKIG
ncbi:hypothetical protein [Butyrivibrio sp. INlla14]|uniref:hypothetical protein n=1 Tax=Butyrivibrio sp. INlla14 TaxID=1520808 RepID=UPI000876A3C9|nr:hypothetical protein [Butyrivibrio sp. INlla14]SCY56979.1 hypothetical protein SAMN02910371_02831 [Butyrivibrio sp. INlla14]